MAEPRGFVTTTTYYADGQPQATIDPLAHRTTTTYDKANRTKTVTNARGFVTTSTYYADGQLRSTKLPLAGIATLAYDKANRQIRSTNPANESTTSTYFADGQLQSTIDPLLHRTSYAYDRANRRIETLDAEEHLSTVVYDDAGRTIANVNALALRVSYTYDQADRRTRLTDPRGNSTTFVYDDAGREIVEIDALTRRVTTTYDAAGNRESLRDPRGNITTFTYDAANRLTTHKASDGVCYTFAYDSANNRTLADTTHGRYTTTYTPRSETATVTNPQEKRITYTYDAVASQRATLTDPDGGRFTYSYDERNRLSTLKNPHDDRTSFVYDQADRETGKHLANGVVTTHVYDIAGRNTVVRHTDSMGDVLVALTYTYDKVNNRSAVVEASGDRVTWAYDPKYQLKHERRSGANAYDVTHVYDPTGNRTLELDSGTRTTYVYDVTNAVTRENTNGELTTYLYDANGNRTQKQAPIETTYYAWDSLNRMIVAEPIAGSTTYVYDADGLRVRKTSETDDVLFIYDGKKVLQETDDSGDVTAEYTFTTEEYGNLQSEFGSETAFPLPDAQGNIIAIADGAQQIDDTRVFRAFGEIEDHTGASESPFAYLGLQSYYLEPALEFYVLGSGIREYDFKTLQFFSRDPAPAPDDEDNLRRYAGNNPANRIDPSGRQHVGGSTVSDDRFAAWFERFKTLPREQQLAAYSQLQSGRYPVTADQVRRIAQFVTDLSPPEAPPLIDLSPPIAPPAPPPPAMKDGEMAEAPFPPPPSGPSSADLVVSPAGGRPLPQSSAVVAAQSQSTTPRQAAVDVPNRLQRQVRHWDWVATDLLRQASEYERAWTEGVIALLSSAEARSAAGEAWQKERVEPLAKRTYNIGLAHGYTDAEMGDFNNPSLGFVMGGDILLVHQTAEVIEGWDLGENRRIEGEERLQRTLFVIGGHAGNVAFGTSLVASASPTLAARMYPSGAIAAESVAGSTALRAPAAADDIETVFVDFWADTRGNVWAIDKLIDIEGRLVGGLATPTGLTLDAAAISGEAASTSRALVPTVSVAGSATPVVRPPLMSAGSITAESMGGTSRALVPTSPSTALVPVTKSSNLLTAPEFAIAGLPPLGGAPPSTILLTGPSRLALPATAPTKPPLPQAVADARSVPRFRWQGHQNAAQAEQQLAQTVHNLPDQAVVRWGDPIGSHGADVISVNMRTGEVTLWDAKFRSADVTIQPSPTFGPNSPRLQNAINEAIITIQNNQTLPASVRQAALRNLQQGNVTTRTVGFGNAKNSTLR